MPRTKSSSGGEPPDIPVEPALPAQLRHDLRGLIAAATTNIEYLRDLPDLPGEAPEVLVEIENVLRLAANVVEHAGPARDPRAVVEVDLRALFWIARRRGAAIVVDATLAPFTVRGSLSSLHALVDAIAGCAIEGSISVDQAFGVHGLDPVKALGVVSGGTTLPVTLHLLADGSIEIRRR